MTFYQIIKKYLDKHCEENPEFKERYSESRLNECLEFIKNQASKQKVDNCAIVDDETVFHWARDFYNDGGRGILKETGKISATVEFDSDDDEETEIEKPVLKEAKPKEPKVKKVKDLGYEQMSLF